MGLRPFHTWGDRGVEAVAMNRDEPRSVLRQAQDTSSAPTSWSSRAEIKPLPAARAAATSAGRALPMPRNPTCTISPICGGSRNRRIGLGTRRERPPISSRKSMRVDMKYVHSARATNPLATIGESHRPRRRLAGPRLRARFLLRLQSPRVSRDRAAPRYTAHHHSQRH